MLPKAIGAKSDMATEGRSLYVQLRLLLALEAVNAVVLSCSAYKLYSTFCGLNCPIGNAPAKASVSCSLLKPVRYCSFATDGSLNTFTAFMVCSNVA